MRWLMLTGARGQGDMNGSGRMADTEPLLFRSQLGALRPANEAAEEAVRGVGDELVRIEIKRTSGNVLRLRWYWVMLRLFLENSDFFEGPITPKILHKEMKKKYGLGTPIKSKSTGEIIDWDVESISFAAMPENERAKFVDFVADYLGKALGVPMETLKQEAQAA